MAFAFSTFAPERAAAQSFDDSGSAQLSQKAATEVLEKFRAVGVADTCFRFTLTHVPRRGGTETVHNGVIWTSWRNGPIFRVELTPASDTKATPVTPVRFILKSGRDPSLWQLDASGKAARVISVANKPFLPGLIATPLELQQPFAFWKDAKYLETRRFRGRPTHFFQMTPPEDFKLAQPEIGFVRIGIDKGYERVLMQAMIYDSKGEELRKLEVEGFSKVKGTYIPEELRFHDLVTRDKDIFVVRQAAVGLRHADSIFNPHTLDKSATQPDEKLFEKVN
jgi:hypothetical protein